MAFLLVLVRDNVVVLFSSALPVVNIIGIDVSTVEWRTMSWYAGCRCNAKRPINAIKVTNKADIK
jgi:hypothetical protein